jgi:hypothetical protein
MKSGEETRVGPLEVNFAEVLGEDYSPPQGDFSASPQVASRDRQAPEPSHRDADLRSGEDEVGFARDEDEVVDMNAPSQSNTNVVSDAQDDSPADEIDQIAHQAEVDTEADDEQRVQTPNADDLDEPLTPQSNSPDMHGLDPHAWVRHGEQDVEQDGDTEGAQEQKKQMDDDFGNPDEEQWDENDESNNFDRSGASSLSQLEEAPASSEPEERRAEEASSSPPTSSSLSQLDSEAEVQQQEDMEQVKKLQERLVSQKRKLEHRHSLHRNHRNSHKAAHKAASHGRGRGGDRARPARHRPSKAVTASSYETTGTKGTAKHLEMRRKLYRDHAQRIAEAGMKWKVPGIRHSHHRKDSIAVNPRSLVRHKRHQRADDHDEGDDEDHE